MSAYTDLLERITGHVVAIGNVEAREVSETTDFVMEGLLDSFAILNLIMDLETVGGFRFDPVTLAADEARTVGGLARLALEAEAQS